MLRLAQIIEITQARVLQISPFDFHIHHLLIDSRKIAYPQHSLFFAIRGERHDGHDFLEELYLKGLRSFVIEYPPAALERFPEANIIQVENSIEALQKIASVHRLRFGYPVIAITGSNGKTIVKEWLTQMLTKSFNIVRSPKSYNSQVGVPLSVWQMQANHELAIFEAGISQMGEMARLEEIIKPSIGLITNIGPAHDEGFAHRADKIREKLRLFAHCERIFYCQDHTEIHQMMHKMYGNDPKLFGWSRENPKAALYLKDIHTESSGTSLEIVFRDTMYRLHSSFADEASLENLMHCIGLSLFLGLEFPQIQEGLHRIEPVEMRLSLKQGIQQTYLVDDSYNNDLAGLEIALDFLNAQKQKPKKIAILSDLLESGMEEKVLYAQIARLLEEKGIHELMGIGDIITRNRHFFKLKKNFFTSTEDFLDSSLLYQLSEAILLIKGARVFGFERIVAKLQQRSHGTVLEIDLDALVHNLNFYKSCLQPNTKMMIMVKAFAYGSGSAEVASLLQFHRVDYLAVAYTDEGAFLRENGIQLPIMVMNPNVASFDQILRYGLEPELYSFKILEEFVHFIKSQKNNHPTINIHLKIDSGMHRLGFEENEIPALCVFLKDKLPSQVRVVSVFSHLSGADEDTHNDFSQEQIRIFKRCTLKIEETLGYSFLKHILNSPGILRFPEAHLDMVRLGIGLYGIEANQRYQHKLEPIGTLKTSISQIKYIPQGQTIGYGRKGIAVQDTKIATIAIGYADGFSRKLSNGVGTVLVRGQVAPVIGNVCMDMTMIDVTGIEVEEGDEVIIFDRRHPIQEMAAKLGTISYEILTNVSERVKRIFYAK
ncbi:MAG: bifunctional UDP-N-acetylmuramoyl-tripeptide:D-alanyl-D-alanine ligase/alanine racemase [Microscillaceae bacterium]|nr:bifunctional UDP-N-acetylmuramoyl-tripeptide:D-alanyl-D-alanine ligase/alanine racemase [Microscillaceae bacterium]